MMPPAACGAPMASTLLTREQYANTLGDLLGFDVRPAVKFTDASGRTYRAEAHVSALEAEDLMNTAAGIADQAVQSGRLARLLPCDPMAAGEAACADQFIDQFGARATRRPLTPDARADFSALYAAGRATGDFATGIKWVIDGLLQSPDFLYHLVAPAPGAHAGQVVPLDDFAIGERLAYFLWNSGPDEPLWSAASKGALHTPAQLAAQVARMGADPRAARTREDFYRAWLNLDIVSGLTRDDPAYTPALARALADSALAGIHDVYRGDGKSDSLLGSGRLFVDPLLASVYGAPAVTGSGLTPVLLAQQRRGLLTHPALMATLAEHDTSDPIHRGKFVFSKLLCRTIPDPPNMIPDLPPLAPNLTTRQRLEAHRASPACASCHSLFDPIGLAFENFDSLGRFRSSEHGAPIDSSGQILDSDLDVSGPFPDGFALLDRLSHSQDARRCLAGQWYEYATRRESDDADKCALTGIEARFASSGDLNDLLVAIAESDTFRNRLVVQE
jgi:hypothetical protein